MDVSGGSFWGKLMRFTPPVDIEKDGGWGIEKITEWHKALIARLKELEKEEIKMEEKGEGDKGKWRLRKSFADVFVVIEGGWQNKRVLVIWKDEDLARRYGCGDETEAVEKCDGEGSVFRCSLKRAMQLVVSRDPERVGRKSEWNEMLEELVGDEEDGGGSG